MQAVCTPTEGAVAAVKAPAVGTVVAASTPVAVTAVEVGVQAATALPAITVVSNRQRPHRRHSRSRSPVRTAGTARSATVCADFLNREVCSHGRWPHGEKGCCHPPAPTPSPDASTTGVSSGSEAAGSGTSVFGTPAA